MRSVSLILLVCLTLLAVSMNTLAVHDDLPRPGGGGLTVDTTQLAPCLGGWIITYTIGPVTIITCDPHQGNPPW